MPNTAPSPDLSLPSHEPALLKDYRKRCTFDEASIAIYSIAPGTSAERVREIASIPQQDWADVGMETQLVRPATPTPIVAGGTLADAVRAHAAMDVEVTPPRSSGTSDVGWLPHRFVVVTDDESLDERGLLLVYADDVPDREGRVARVDRFFFRRGEMFVLLSGLVMGSHGFSVLRRFYDVDEKKD